jgi:hypothetical protein
MEKPNSAQLAQDSPIRARALAPERPPARSLPPAARWASPVGVVSLRERSLSLCPVDPTRQPSLTTRPRLRRGRVHVRAFSGHLRTPSPL